MNQNTAQIEQLVRQILDEWQAAGRLVEPAVPELAGKRSVAKLAAKESGAAPALTVPGEAGGGRVLRTRLVTTADLAGSWERGSSLEVMARTVVTPAAVDLLRKLGVTLKRSASQPTAAVQVTLVVGNAGESCPAGLVAALRQARIGVEQLAEMGMVTMVQEMAEQIARSGRLGILLAAAPAAALCGANRQKGVRAVLAAERNAIWPAIHAVGANLLVIGTSGPRGSELIQLARRFAQEGPFPCPPELQAVLS